jgi:hypothetical protein
MDQIEIVVTILKDGDITGRSVYRVDAPLAVGLTVKELAKACEKFAGDFQLDGEVSMNGTNTF